MSKSPTTGIHPVAVNEEGAALYLGLSRHTLRQIRYRGEIAAIVHRGRKISYLYEDLDRYLAMYRMAGGYEARAVGKCAAWPRRATRVAQKPEKAQKNAGNARD